MKTKTLITAAALFAGILSFGQATTLGNTITFNTHYLGSSNSVDVQFRRGNVVSGLIGANKVSLGLYSNVVGESVSIGYAAGQYSSSVASHPRNVYVGYGTGRGTTVTANSGINN